MRTVDGILACLLVACLVVAFRGDGGGPLIGADLPIKAEGFHCVILREQGQRLSKGHAAVLGSQEVEDAAGTYLVVWTDQSADTIPAIYHDALERMRQAETPQWCLCDSRTGKSYVGPPPETIDDALAQIASIKGGQP